MKPAWDQLGDAFKDSKTVVIGDVDCTVHQGLCSEHGVKGYPTVKYYVNGEWSDYEGGRDYDALKEFADENSQLRVTLDIISISCWKQLKNNLKN